MSIFSSSWRTAARMLLVVLCSIPAADLAFRTVGDRPSRDLTGLFAPFGDGGYRLGIGVRTSAEFYSGWMEVVTDSLGLRVDTAASTWTSPSDTVDFLLLGDSQGFGNLLNFEQSLAGQVNSHARKAGLRTANASVGGHYLENQLEIARWLVSSREVRVRHVVVLLTPVLIATSARYNRASVDADGRLYAGDQGWSWRVRMWLKTNTVVYARLRGAFRRLNGLWASKTSRVEASAEGDAPGALELYNPASNAARGVGDSLSRSLARIHAWSDSVSAQLLLVYLPLSTEMHFETIQEAARRSAVTVDPNLPFILASRVADSLRIPRFSCRTALLRTIDRGATIGIGNDPHYSADASSECARDIWTFLQH